MGSTKLNGQISIPYGNDGLLYKDSTEIELRFELDGREWNS